MRFRRGPSNTHLLVAFLCWIGIWNGGLTENAFGQDAPPPQLQFLEAHETAIYAVDYTPDGKTFVTGSVDGQVKVWEQESGTVIRSIQAHQGTVLSLAVAPNGLQMASGGLGGNVHLFDMPRPHPLVQMANTVPGVPTSIVLSSDGSLVLTGDEANYIRMWDAIKGTHLRDFTGSQGGIVAITLLTDPRVVLALDKTGTLRGWNLDDAKLLGTVQMPPANALSSLPEQQQLLAGGEDGLLRVIQWPPAVPVNLQAHSDQVTALVLSPDQSVVASAGLDKNVHLSNVADGKHLRTLTGQPGKATSVGFSHDGKIVGSGGDTGVLKFWQTLDSADLLTLAGHTGAVNALVFHPKENLAASGGLDGTIRVWQLPEAPKKLAGHANPLTSIDISKDGKTIVSASQDKTAKLWKSGEEKPAVSIAAADQPVQTVSLSPDGKTVAMGDSTGRIFFRGAADGSDLGLIEGHNAGVSRVVWLPDGKKLISSGLDGTVKIWAAPAVAPKTLPALPVGVQRLIASSKGEFLVTATDDGALRIIDAKTGKPTQTFKGHVGPVTSLALNFDDSSVAVGSNTGSVRFWNPKAEEPVGEVGGHVGAVQALAFHPKGGQFATAGQDGTVRFWNVPVTNGPLAGHEMPIQALSLSLDRKTALTGDAAGGLRLWNIQQNKELRKLAGGEQAVQTTAFRRDGVQVVAGDSTGTVQIWNTADGKSESTFRAHGEGVTGLDFHPQHKLLASGSSDGTVKIWELPIVASSELAKHGATVQAVAIADDGSLTISAGSDKTMRVHNAAGTRQLGEEFASAVTATALGPKNVYVVGGTESGLIRLSNVSNLAESVEIGGHTGAVTDLAFHPQATHFASSGADGTIRIWEKPAAPKVMAGHQQPATVVSVSPDGKLVATASSDKTVRIWNLENGQAVRSLTQPAAATAVAWKSDNLQLVTGSADNSVRVWNAADGKQLQLFEGHTKAVNAVAFTADGKSVISGSADNSIKVWEIPAADAKEEEKKEPLVIAGHTKAITSLKVLSDKKTLASGSEDGTVRFWNIADGKQTRSINRGSPVTSISISPDGKLLAATAADKLVKLYNPANGQAAGELAGATAGTSSVSFSRDNLRVAGTSADGTLHVWEATGRLLETVHLPRVKITTAAFGLDGRNVVIASDDKNVRLQRLALEQLIVAVEGKAASSVAYTPDGNFVVSGALDNTVKQWNVADGKQIRVFAGHTAAVNDVDVSGDGLVVVASSADKTARLWTLSNGQALKTLQHTTAVPSISASKDGKRVVTGSDNGTIRVWDVTTGLVLQEFKEQAKPVLSVDLAADGKTVVSAADVAVQKSVVSAQLVLAAHEGGTHAVLFAADATHLLSAGADKAVRQFDLTGKPIRQLVTAAAAVRCLAQKPDAAQIAAGSDDKGLYLVRFDNGKLERKIETPAAVTSVSYSLDNAHLAAAGADGKLRIYGPADPLLLEEIPGTEPIAAAAFASDGRTILSVGGDNAVHVLTRSLERILLGHQGVVDNVAFAPDGASLLSAGADKTVRRWNLATGAAMWSVGGHTTTITGLAMTTDATRVVSASLDKTVRLWNAANGAVLQTITVPQAVRGMALNAESTRIATASDDNLVRVWDLATQKELEAFRGHQGQIRAVAFGADGKTIFSASVDKTIREWNIAAQLVVVADATRIYDLEVFADGSHFVTGGEDKLVKLWKADGTSVRQFSYASPVRSISIRPDGLQIAVGGSPQNNQNNVYVWNVADAKLVQNIATSAAVVSVAFSNDNKIAVAGADNHLRIYRAEDQLPLQDFTSPATLYDVEFAPDNRTLYAAAADNSAYVFTFALDHLLTGHASAVNSLCYTSDGKQLISAGADGTVRLWDVAGEKVVANFVGNTAIVNQVVLSDDGKSLAVAATDSAVRVYPIPAEAVANAAISPTATFQHPSAVRTVSLVNGRVAAGGDDNLIRIWDIETGQELERLTGHTGALRAVAIVNDGKAIFSGSVDRSVRLWTPTVVDAAKAHEAPVRDMTISRDGKQVFTIGDDKLIASWSTDELQQVQKFAGMTSAPTSVSVSAEGGFVAVGAADGTARIWNTKDGGEVASIKADKPIVSLVLGEQGNKLVVATDDNLLRNYGLSKVDDKLTLLPTNDLVGHTAAVRTLAISADDRMIASAGSDQTVKIWYAASAAPRHTFAKHQGPIYDLAFNADGSQLGVASGDGTASILNASTGGLVATSEGHTNQVSGITFHPNGKEWATCSLDRTIRIWSVDPPPAPEPEADAEKGEEKANEKAEPKKDAAEEQPEKPVGPIVAFQLHTISEEIEGGLYAIEYAANGSSLFTAGTSAAVKRFTGPEWKLDRTSLGHNDSIYALRHNAAKSRIATVDYSGQLFIWNASDLSLLYHQQLPLSAAYSFSYAPNGTEILVGGTDHRLLKVLLPSNAR